MNNKKMKKIVINECYGGYGLSLLALVSVYERKHCPLFLYKESYDEKGGSSYEKIQYRTTKELTDERLLADHTILMTLKDFGQRVRYSTYEESLARSSLPNNIISIFDFDDNRSDPDLVAVVEALGDMANDPCSDLTVVSVPEGASVDITETDGYETLRWSLPKIHVNSTNVNSMKA